MHADVAGVEPAVAHRLGGRLGTLVVALHHVGAAHDDLAALARRHRPFVVVDAADLDAEDRQPTVPGFDGRCSWLKQTTGDVSDSPSLRGSRTPKVASNCAQHFDAASARRPTRTAAGARRSALDRARGSRARARSSAQYIVGTPIQKPTCSRAIVVEHGGADRSAAAAPGGSRRRGTRSSGTSARSSGRAAA